MARVGRRWLPALLCSRPGVPWPSWSAPTHFDEGWRRYESPAVVAGPASGTYGWGPVRRCVLRDCPAAGDDFPDLSGVRLPVRPRSEARHRRSGRSELTVAAQELDGVEVGSSTTPTNSGSRSRLTISTPGLCFRPASTMPRPNGGNPISSSTCPVRVWPRTGHAGRDHGRPGAVASAGGAAGVGGVVTPIGDEDFVPIGDRLLRVSSLRGE